MGDAVKAVVKKDVIVCGVCGHKIAECSDLVHGVGHGKIRILCNHKSASVRCKTVNQIDL